MKRLKEKTKEQLALSEKVIIGRILDKIFGYATSEGIEEMIFESSGDAGVVKFYSCGEKRGGLEFSLEVKKEIFSSLKDLSASKRSASKDKGEFKRDMLGGWEIFSVSFYGKGPDERAIVTLSRGCYEVMSLRRLGLEKRALGQVKEVLQKGRGAVVIISPFNSGKTTTLYSLVEQVNRPDLNVTTFEHQIKVDMPNINQSQVSPGKNNVSLSSILKQDPDVVMIDELIDKDGVEAALHLAERGYFVLAGIYGTNLSSTLDFMQGLGVSLPLFVSSVKMVINQRLVFSNCPRCLVKEKVSKDVLAEIKKIFSRSGFFDELKNCRIIPVSAKSVDDLSFYKGAGCQFCKKTGLSGKTAVFEVLSVDDDVKKMIREGHFSSLKGQSAEQGNFTLSESAFMKAAAGIIPLSEVLKIIKEPGL